MNYVYFGNNRIGMEVLRWLMERGEPPAALVVHPPERGKYRDELLALAALPPGRVFEGSALRQPETLAALAALQPDLGLSVLFGYLLKPELLALFPRGCFNLHPALLPHGRGAYPNVWSIVEGTPAGVTLHQIDRGVDTGDIFALREVPVAPTDTGATLYARLEDAALELFKEAWPLLIAGKLQGWPQPPGGSYHRARDVEILDRIDPDQQMRAGDLIDLLRARTFPPYRGAYLDLPACRLYLRLELFEERK